MELSLSNVKLFKVKQSKDWTNLMVLSDDDDLSFSLKNVERGDLINKLIKLKGSKVNLLLDANQLQNGNVYFVVLDVMQANGK